MRTSRQRIRPTIIHTVAGRQLREYTIDGQPWFPIHDLIPLLETTRNATQIARSLPSWTTCRLQTTLRPATNMINALGILELVHKAPQELRTDRESRVYQLARWANRHLKKPDITASQKIVAEMRALQGDMKILKTQIDERNATIEGLLDQIVSMGQPDKGADPS